MLLADTVERFSLTAVISVLLDMASKVIEFITADAVLSVLFVGSIISVVCYVISRVKETSKR